MQQNLSLQDLVDEIDTPPKREGGKWRVVVAGEFESGKSSVINALLRSPVIPCNPGMIARPRITVKHSRKPKIQIKDINGRSFVSTSFNEILNNELVESCTLRLSLEQYQGIEIIEIPFRHESGISATDKKLMADSDLIIWVTIASQAWRLSEKAIIEDLPYQMREKSILAISRADKLRSAADVNKIESRLQVEASKFFSEIVFMQASTKNLQRAVTDAQLWEETGGAALASIIRELVIEPMAQETKRQYKS